MARSALNIIFSGTSTATLQKCLPAEKKISMARFPRSEPLFADDSWGLLLVPILSCVVLLVSAFVWL
jgi:hypothetical protein